MTGLDRLTIKLLRKATLRFENCTHTNFGISEEFYGRRCDPLGGLGQGMMLSTSSNRRKCFCVPKALEEKCFRFSIIDSITLEKMLKIVSALVDGTNL